MKVPFVDLYELHKPMEDQFIRLFQSVLKKSSFIAGDYTHGFEDHFANYCGAKFSVFTNNGTSALLLALLALKLPAKSEVIIPANTFIATVEAVVAAGLKPVLVDIDPESFLLDLQATKKALTSKTRVIMPVHLYGQMVDVVALRHLTRQKNQKIYIVEDACQSHGARLNGTAKLHGDIACYSFYPGKNLGALGEGGGVVTNSSTWHRWMQLYKNHGSQKKYYHEIMGFNYRQSEIQAAFLDHKLQYLDEGNARRVQAAEWYAKYLSGVAEVVIQQPKIDGGHVYHLLVVRVKKRALLQEYLHEHGIQTGLHYPYPLHTMPAMKEHGYHKGDFPHTEKAAKEILSLPMFATITESQVKYVCKKIVEFYQTK